MSENLSLILVLHKALHGSLISDQLKSCGTGMSFVSVIFQSRLNCVVCTQSPR